MRSLNHLFCRSITDQSIEYAYRWLFSRAQHLLRLSQSHISYSKSKSLFGIFRSLINQYHRHVPIEYLCGSAMFFNRLFIVNRHVLIPRRDSECLIHHVQQLYEHDTNRQSIVEIGTGSGCLSITLCHLFPHWQIHACDISSSALRVARNNAYLHHCHNIEFHRGNIFDSKFLENISFDIIVSNPPYISKEQISYCDRGIFYEPFIALFADPPLKFYAEIIHRAINGWLKPEGYLVFECSPFNVHHIKQLFNHQQDHFQDIKIIFDTNQLPRVISAKNKKVI
ncbi:unnamed protein product [Rotaria sp. Silwood2]|nr:unnamed protein product [Rotaria sp. Silwood2]